VESCPEAVFVFSLALFFFATWVILQFVGVVADKTPFSYIFLSLTVITWGMSLVEMISF
jgi:Ca2+/Na+ antiporter